MFNNLPVMARIAALNEHPIAHFPRDQNHDLMHRYHSRQVSRFLPSGFFDENFRNSPSTLAVAPIAVGLDRSARQRRIRPKLPGAYAANRGREMLRDCGNSAERGLSKDRRARFGTPPACPQPRCRGSVSDASGASMGSSIL
jgi:hypothetical protein